MKFVLRQLLKNPGFTAVALLTLALGIGVNAVVFGVAKTVLLHPLGFDDADRLMWIRLVNTSSGHVEEQLSWRDMEAIRAASKSFEAIATFGSPGAVWVHDDRAEEVPSLRVTPNLAEVLRIRPSLGRLIQPIDTTPGADSVVMISHELWQSRFGGRTNVIGTTVRIEEKARTIVGVLPPGLQFPFSAARWVRGWRSVRSGLFGPWGRQAFLLLGKPRWTE